MCGIVGMIGHADTPSVDTVLQGLKKLEYRGYDSSGIAAITPNGLDIRKAVGKIKALEDELANNPFAGTPTLAIGHTRWATHGEPTHTNAHPHVAGQCAVVHNGIIENFKALREELEAKGATFQSETDTETLPHLINQAISEGLSPLEAVVKTVNKAEGAFAFGALFHGNEETLIGARRGAPLVVGKGDGANYLGSDPMALSAYTNKFVFLENDDIVELTADSVRIYDKTGTRVDRPVQKLDITQQMIGKGNYRHFMHKEIHEQPRVVAETLVSFLDASRRHIALPEMPFDLGTLPQLTIIACGTSWHAALVAKYWIEQFARIPVNVDIASEYRYRNPPLVKGGACLFISQSGETADTLAALEHVKEAGQHILSIVNVPDSSIARASDVVLHTKAGPEIGVASTKAFTTQLVVLALLALEMAHKAGHMSQDELETHIHELKELPARMTDLPHMDDELHKMARQIMHATSALFIGRGAMYPIALEGALKLKEISYIHAEGYAAGEMKHGPIALIDENVPVICLAPFDELYEKNISNMQETEARRGRVFLFTDHKGVAEAGENKHRRTFEMPDMGTFVQPIFYTLPMQILSYHVAVLKGTDVDQPRNLAKSVTVE